MAFKHQTFRLSYVDGCGIEIGICYHFTFGRKNCEIWQIHCEGRKNNYVFFWAVPPGTQTVQTLAVDRALRVPALL